MLTRLHMKIHTNSKDVNSVLIMTDGYLIAILVRLDDQIHGPTQGQWHLEAQFDHLPSQGQLFETLEAAEAWIATEMKTPDARTGIIPMKRP